MATTAKRLTYDDLEAIPQERLRSIIDRTRREILSPEYAVASGYRYVRLRPRGRIPQFTS